MENLRAGNGVSVIPLHAELTTVQAAELLNASRPHLIKQIEAGQIAHHMVGTHPPIGVLDTVDAMATRRRRHPKTRDDIIEVLTASLPQAMVALSG